MWVILLTKRATSGLISAVFVCPLDVVKIRLQNQQGNKHIKKTFPLLFEIGKIEGIRYDLLISWRGYFNCFNTADYLLV